ncbi:MAG: hypothetical protein ACM3MG_04385 [Bacillota bacterium]
MANNLQRLTSIILGFLLLSPGAGAFDNYKEFKRDHWDFEVGTNYFYSEANYVSMGNGTSSLTSGNHYQLLDVNLSTRYMPAKDWSVFVMGTISSAESKDSVATRSNSTLSQVLGGFDFVMYDGWFQLVPELAVLVPLQKVDTTSDAVLNSEGVYEMWARLTAQKDFGILRAYGWAGFNYRGEERSYLMPWGVGMQLKGRRVRLGGEIFGFQSISDDKDTSNKTARNAYLNTVDAGSYKFYSVNPSVVDSLAYLTWMINSKWSLQANTGLTLAGENSAAGFHVGGFIRYSFDLSEGYKEKPYIEPEASPVPEGRSNLYDQRDEELSSSTKVRQFKEQTSDGVDQQLFKPRPTKRKPRVNDQQLQQQLNDAEFEIELKGKNKH